MVLISLFLITGQFSVCLRERIPSVSRTVFLENRGQDCYVLSSDYKDMEAELPVFLPLLTEKKPELLLIDSYSVSPYYLERVGSCTKTAYLDDICAFPYPVDFVIDYNIYADFLPYGTPGVTKAGKSDSLASPTYLLGCAYVPLREEFRSVPYEVRQIAKKVLITTGGSDKYNLAGQILQAALKDARTAGLEYHVVSGALNSHLAELTETAESSPNVHIHCNVTNMAELMQECDIAVTAGGSTVYELCAVGVPFLCFSFAQNQEKMVETFVQEELVCFGGSYLQDGKAVVAGVVAHMATLAADRENRERYSRKERALVDGLGAERIAVRLSGDISL